MLMVRIEAGVGGGVESESRDLRDLVLAVPLLGRHEGLQHRTTTCRRSCCSLAKGGSGRGICRWLGNAPAPSE